MPSNDAHPPYGRGKSPSVNICNNHANMNDIVRKGGKPKGSPKSGGGSRAGIPNKATADARAAIGLFVEDNADRLHDWLNAVAEGDPENDIKPNPAKAFELFQSVVEYHIPKLARTEAVVEHKGAFTVTLTDKDAKL